jgi:hypothetical protein
MFETPEQFRDRIRGHLKGSFAKKAEENGIKTLSEVDPQGQPQPGQTAGGQANQSGQQNQQQSIQAPPQQANFKKTLQTAFENLSAAFKSKGQLQSGTKLKNSGSVAQKAINDMYVAVNNQKLDNKTLSNTFKKSIGTVLDAIVKDVESLSKTNQQQAKQDQQSGGSAQQPQQMNAEAVPGENLQLADENYGDGVVNNVGQAPVVEKNDPISVDSMQGILKFATPDQIGDAIKKMTPEDFQQFTNGLQKTALDVIAKSVNAGGAGAGGGPVPSGGDQSQGKNNNPSGSGGNTDKEGNLKLGEL